MALENDNKNNGTSQTDKKAMNNQSPVVEATKGEQSNDLKKKGWYIK